MAKKRLLSLDLLRGLAALLVSIGHFGDWGCLHFEETFAYCVPFFFMLSGYVLAHAYGDAIIRGNLCLYDYFVLRIARLYPLHIITFIAIIFFYASIELARLFFKLPIADVIGLHATPIQVLETLTLTHYIFGVGVSFNTPSWSISVEFWCSFYIFFMYHARIPRLFKASLISSGLFVLVLVQYKGGMYGADRYLFVGINTMYLLGSGCFSVGWVLYHWKHEAEIIVKKVPRFVFWTLAITIFVIIVTDVNVINYDSIIYISFTIIIMGLASAEIRSPIIQKIMKKAGDWSYGIYMWHLPIMLSLVAVARLLEKMLGAEIVHTVIMDVIYISLVLYVSSISYKAIVSPAKVGMKRLLTSLQSKEKAPLM